MLDLRVEAAVPRHRVLHHPGVAVGLEQCVPSARVLAVPLLPGALYVLGVGVVYAIAVRVFGPDEALVLRTHREQHIVSRPGLPQTENIAVHARFNRILVNGQHSDLNLESL